MRRGVLASRGLGLLLPLSVAAWKASFVVVWIESLPCLLVYSQLLQLAVSSTPS